MKDTKKTFFPNLRSSKLRNPQSKFEMIVCYGDKPICGGGWERILMQAQVLDLRIWGFGDRGQGLKISKKQFHHFSQEHNWSFDLLIVKYHTWVRNVKYEK